MNQKTKVDHKKRKTLYWGIELDGTIFENEQIIKHLESNKQLIISKALHSTLLFVGGKKKNDNDILSDDDFLKLEGKKCKVVVDSFGHSELALALSVKSVTCIEDDIPVPSGALKQHVTVALKQGTLPKYSVKTLLGEGSITEFDDVIVLFGHIKRWCN
jgi:hypothetical protein